MSDVTAVKFFSVIVRQVNNWRTFNYAPVAKLAYAIDLGSISVRSAGSIPVRCTTKSLS